MNEGRVPSMAHALGQHRYDISFVPKENADHTITIRFNNEPVPGMLPLSDSALIHQTEVHLVHLTLLLK